MRIVSQKPRDWCCRRCDRARLTGAESIQAHRRWSEQADARARVIGLAVGGLFGVAVVLAVGYGIVHVVTGGAL